MRLTDVEASWLEYLSEHGTSGMVLVIDELSYEHGITDLVLALHSLKNHNLVKLTPSVCDFNYHITETGRIVLARHRLVSGAAS